jgi:citrate synthase
VSAELRRRAALPDYVVKVIEALPPGTHPMTQFATAILALQVGLDAGGAAGARIVGARRGLLPSLPPLLKPHR